MYQIVSYIKFLLRSTNHHGVHSPFVYNFVTKCLYNKTKYEAYRMLKDYRNDLLSSTSAIEVLDLGEGSKVLKKGARPIRQMAKTSSSSKKNAKLLYRIGRYFKFNSILELGTSLGMGTYAIALGCPNANFITIEGCPNTSNFTKSKFKALNVKPPHFIKGDFKTVIPDLNTDNYDFVFFDGHHNKKATLYYFEMLLSKMNNDSVFIFDDIYWSKEMTEAWEHIKAHPKVTVSIDTFHLGIIFFRQEQAKEHFKIRL